MSHFYMGHLDGMEGRRSNMREEWAQAAYLLRELPAPWSELWDAFLAEWELVVLGLSESQLEMRTSLAAMEEKIAGSGLLLRDAVLYAQAGQAELARRHLEEWEGETPQRTRVKPENRSSELLARGMIAWAEERLDESLDLFRIAAEASTLSGYSSAHLAWAYDQAGMPDSAIVTYRRYLDGPFHTDRLETDAYYLPLAYERLGQLYEERGEMEEAARYHALFVDLWAHADPELQPRVEAAREALDRIRDQGIEGSPLPH